MHMIINATNVLYDVKIFCTILYHPLTTEKESYYKIFNYLLTEESI